MAEKQFNVSFNIPASLDKERINTILAEKFPTSKNITITKKRQAGGSGPKGKGHDFERMIAEKLGIWWWGKSFRRTPGSGAWDKQQHDQQVIAAGDIFAPIEANFPFCVECKKRKLPIDFFDYSSELRGWWAHIVADAIAFDKRPLLIFCADRDIEYVAFDLEVKQLLISKHNISHGILTLNIVDNTICIMKLKHFLSYSWPKY